MEKKIMVSVAVPFYNQERYVAETLNSVLAQKTNFDFEIVCGDDCSRDGTCAILKDFQTKYPDKIKVIFNEKNRGLVLNIKNIFDHCRGKYLALLGGDDLFCSELKLQKQFDFLENNPEFGLVHSDIRLLIEDNRHQYKVIDSVDDYYKRPVKSGHVFEDLLLNNFIAACAAFFRRDLYLKHGDFEGWNKLGFKMEDYPMWLEFSRVSKFGYINQSLSDYRISSDTVSHPKSKSKYFEFWSSFFDVGLFFLNKYEVSKNIRFSFLRKYHRYYFEYSLHFRNRDLAKKSLDFFLQNGERDFVYMFYYWAARSWIVWFFLKSLRKFFKSLRINIYK